MSYCYFNGYLKFKNKPTNSIEEYIKEKLNALYDERKNTFEVGGYEEIYEEDFYDVFGETHGMLESGEINCSDDYGDSWGYILVGDVWREKAEDTKQEE